MQVCYEVKVFSGEAVALQHQPIISEMMIDMLPKIKLKTPLPLPVQKCRDRVVSSNHIALKLIYIVSVHILKEKIIVREYDQEIPLSQIADNPMATRGRATPPSQDTRKTN